MILASDDHKMDTKASIENYIEQKVRELLKCDMNEYQDPAWVQAAELFNEIVVPCESYCSRGLLALGIEIVKEADNQGCRVEYQKIPGMYNVKLFSGEDKSDVKVDVFDYSRTVNSIKAWNVQNEEFFKKIFL